MFIPTPAAGRYLRPVGVSDLYSVTFDRAFIFVWEITKVPLLQT